MAFAIGAKEPGQEWGLLHSERKKRGVLASYLYPQIFQSADRARDVAGKWKAQHPGSKAKVLEADRQKAPFIKSQAQAADIELWATTAFEGFNPFKWFFKNEW